MSLSARLKTPPPRVLPGPPCPIVTVLGLLKGAEHGALKAMLASSEWTGSAISEALDDEGYGIRKDKINKHRRGACRCFK